MSRQNSSAGSFSKSILLEQLDAADKRERFSVHLDRTYKTHNPQYKKSQRYDKQNCRNNAAACQICNQIYDNLSHQDHERLVDVLHHDIVIGVSVHKGDDPSDQRNVSYNRKLLGILCHVRYLLTDLEPGSFAVRNHHITGTVTFVSHKRQSVMSTSGVI